MADPAANSQSNSEVIMAVRSVTPATMDEVAAVSTAPTPAVSHQGDENVDMVGDRVLDFSLSPEKDEPPATRQRKGGDFGALALVGKPPISQKRRTSSEGPRGKDRSRAAGQSPWPDITSAVHERAGSAGDEWTIATIVRQLEIDRAQIALLKDTVENLNASRLQDAADLLEGRCARLWALIGDRQGRGES